MLLIMSAAESAISLPFTIDAYGNVAKTTDQSKIWMDRVHTVIGTAVRERVMRPSFGTQVPLSTFDSGEIAQEKIRVEIFNAFNTYLSALTLTNLDVSFDEPSATVSVDVTYSLPNNKEVNTVIGLATISGNKLISEELR